MPRLHRFLALPWRARLLFLEAVFLMIATRLALWLRPLGSVRHAIERMSRRPASNDRRETVRPSGIVRAVRQASVVVPASSCLTEALTTQIMLGRRGLRSTLRIGVRRDGEALEAHAWLERGGAVLVGGGPLDRYTRLPIGEEMEA